VPFQQWILVSIPTWAVAAIMFTVALATAVGGVLLVALWMSAASSAAMA
jgi:hypothetical protein